ncbi:MAG: choice-of-anchor D domain-containing protein, partial [Candidatus Marinimicrobia bacterium]|nr:choice-of-anchor D domain-containing protein [Candidatus Neomarinimicrobiota bacterium]
MKLIKLNLFILLFGSLGYSQFNVSGTISTNTTWALANSPYIITDDVLVDIGVTLTIEAGVTVKVESGKRLQNKGTLIAVGTSGNEIVFTSNQATPTEGYWSSIEFLDETEDATFDGNGDYISGTILEYSNVLYGGGSGSSGAVIMTNSAIYINNVTVQYSASKGIYINKSIGGTVPVIKIENSTITDNSSIGVYCDCYQYNVSITVDSSVIKNNVGGGISTGGGDAGGSHTFNFTNNIVDNNSGTGINGNANGTQTITGNIINNNTGSGIRTRGNGTYTIQNNIVTNNSLVGIHGIYATHIIDNNVIAMNGGGIEISQGGNYTITDNQIYSNSRSDGAAFDPVGGTEQGAWSSPVTMERNTITSNTSSNVGSGTLLTFQPNSGDPSFVINQNNIFGNTASYELKNNRLIALSNINALNNWWGTTTDSEIQAKIYDWNDDGTLGIVDYDPYLSSPDITAPISPPTNVVKSASGSDVQLMWSTNPESDVAGYKVYWGSPTGYSFANVFDIGDPTPTTYILSGVSITDTIALTAYDNLADGTDDQVEGHESWFAYAGDPSPIIVLSPISLDFGVVAVGQSEQRTFSVQNNGSAGLVVSDITSSNIFYTVTPTSFTVPPGGSQTVTVEFTPSTTGIESGELSIIHNASGSPSIVTLMGVGSTSSGTGVSGIISTNTTWALANSPYIITDDVLVDIGVTLTIEAGVTVKVESGK